MKLMDVTNGCVVYLFVCIAYQFNNQIKRAVILLENEIRTVLPCVLEEIIYIFLSEFNIFTKRCSAWKLSISDMLRLNCVYTNYLVLTTVYSLSTWKIIIADLKWWLATAKGMWVRFSFLALHFFLNKYAKYLFANKCTCIWACLYAYLSQHIFSL